MNPLDHQHVPSGTVTDLHAGGPKMIFRDYDHAHFPALELDPEGVRLLIDEVLPGLLEDMLAARAEQAAELAEEIPGSTDDCAESNDSLGKHSDTYYNGDYNSATGATCEWCFESNDEWEAALARDVKALAEAGQ